MIASNERTIVLPDTAAGSRIVAVDLPEARFATVIRGYDKNEVDAYVASARKGHWSVEPIRFTTVTRGYSRAEVDDWIAEARS